MTIILLCTLLVFCIKINFILHPILGMRPSQEDLIAQFKRQGILDDLRRTLFKDFNEHSINQELAEAIIKLVEDEAVKSPSILTRESSKSVALIEGSLGRQTHGAYRDLAKYIDATTVDSADMYKKIDRIVRDLYKQTDK